MATMSNLNLMLGKVDVGLGFDNIEIKTGLAIWFSLNYNDTIKLKSMYTKDIVTINSEIQT